MMAVGNVQVQLVDTPPLQADRPEPELTGLIRRADLVLVLVDLQGDPIGQLEEARTLLERRHILPESERAAHEPRLASSRCWWP
jgi:ribosome-interacting GTPase 1